MKKLNLLILVIFLNVFLIDGSDAKTCEGNSIPGWFSKVQNGEIIEYYQKSKVNSICSRWHSFQGGLLELTIIEQPKGIVEIISRSYEFAYRFNKTGKYNIKYDIKLQDRYGKIYIGHFIMYVEVVKDRW